MASEVAVFEPIKLPDPRRPATLPSLPAWVERLNGAVRLELQMTLDGKSFEKQDVLVLPTDKMPTESQRDAMMAHQDSLRSFLQNTPASSAEAETRVATAVSKLLTVLSGERKSDLVEEARGDVYLDVLDDVPCWAVESAVRRWFRHDCGTDERGRAHDYRWAPDPGTLRKIAQEDVYAIGARLAKVQRVLDAREYIDCTAQIERGKLAMAGLKVAIDRDPFAAGKLTFNEAIELAKSARETSTEGQ